MNGLFRSMTTEVVHTAECRSAGYNCERWKWADGKQLGEVTTATTQYPWLHLCRRCLPGACRCAKCEPPWDDLGPRATWTPRPLCTPPAAFTAAAAYTRGLVREAERLATRPWADDTLTWSRQLLLDAMATAETTGWAR